MHRVSFPFIQPRSAMKGLASPKGNTLPVKNVLYANDFASEENEGQIFVLKTGLGTLAYALEKASNFPLFHFVYLSYDLTRALRYSHYQPS